MISQKPSSISRPSTMHQSSSFSRRTSADKLGSHQPNISTNNSSLEDSQIQLHTSMDKS